jgi:hypothetical protein
MTTNIERQFFDTFGIEPKEKVNQTFNGAEFKVETIKVYPQITDRILLELLCLINQVDMYYYDEEEFYTSFNYENFKQEILSKCKRLADKNAFSEVTGENFKRQVQALFKEE